MQNEKEERTWNITAEFYVLIAGAGLPSVISTRVFEICFPKPEKLISSIIGKYALFACVFMHNTINQKPNANLSYT